MMEAVKRFLRAQAEKYGKPVLMLYALLFLLFMTGVLATVYLLVGWLTVKSPYGVLVITGILVALIFLKQLRKKQ